MDELFIDERIRLIKDFNNQLKDLGQRRGRSLRDIAKESGYAVSTLSAQLSSMRLPSRELLMAYVKTCGGDVEDWLRRLASLTRLLGDNGKSLGQKIRGRPGNTTLDESAQTVRISSPGIDITCMLRGT